MGAQYINRLTWTVAAVPPITTNTLECRQKFVIDVDVIICHAPGRKALLEAPSHLLAIKCDDLWQHRDRLLQSINDGTSDARIDDLRNRAATERQDRRTAGHGLNHRGTEGLRQAAGK